VVARSVPYEVVHIDINDEIITSRTAGEVLAFCERRLAEFNSVNVVTAVHRIAKRPDVGAVREDPASNSLLSAFLAPLRSSAPCDVLGLVHTAWAFSKILFVDDPLRASISAASLRKLHEFEAW